MGATGPQIGDNMGTFTFETGYTSTPTKRASESGSKRVFSAPCRCFEHGLECFHSIKERGTSLSDSTIPSSPARFEWMAHFEVSRNEGTQRYNAGKV